MQEVKDAIRQYKNAIITTVPQNNEHLTLKKQEQQDERIKY
jgi:hypothetical protein